MVLNQSAVELQAPLDRRTPAEQSDGSPAMTTVELFCGIGGFRFAADQLGLKTIWANDLSQTACPVYRDRFGDDALHEGDIKLLLNSVPTHDILTGGFPCQPFSAAGKKEGVRDSRGTLFQAIVDILEQRRPKYFVLENVKRLLSMENGVHFATVLSALSRLDYFIEWRVLNAKDFGLAQNRERIIFTGTKKEISRDVTSDSDLRLASSGELKDGYVDFLQDVSRWPLLSKHKKFSSWGVAYSGRYLSAEPTRFLAQGCPATLKDILELDAGALYDYTAQTKERLHMNEKVDRFVNGVEIVSNQGGGARMGYTIFGVNGLAPTLTASTSRHYERYQVGGMYRRLTPREYARLQGFPDEHCSVARPYDQYALYGNAVPPPLVEWVLAQLMRTSPAPIAQQKNQRSLFHV